MKNPGNKLIATAKSITTILLATCMSACTGCADSSKDALRVPAPAETSVPVETTAPAETAKPEVEESTVNGATSSDAAFTPSTGNTVVAAMKSSVKDYSNERAHCEETWGNWQGTTCIWPNNTETSANTQVKPSGSSTAANPVMSELDRLRALYKQALDRVVVAQANLTSAQLRKEQAVAAFEAATSSVLTAPNEVDQAKAVLALREVQVGQAEDELNAARATMNTVLAENENKIKDAETLAEKVYQDAVKTINDEFNATMASITKEYQDEIALVQKNFDLALKNSQEEYASGSSDASMRQESQKNALQAQYNTDLEAIKKERDAAVTKAESEYNSALAAAEEAFKQAVADMSNDPTYQKLSDELASLAKDLNEKTQNVQTAEAGVQTAKKDLDSALSRKELADQNLAECEKLVEARKQNKETLETQIAALEAQIVQTETDVVNLENQLEALKLSKAESQKAIEDAQAALDAEKANAQDIDAMIAAARQAYDSAQQAYQTAEQEFVSKGVLGFYESLKDSDPVGYAASKQLIDYATNPESVNKNGEKINPAILTNLGAEGDATSIKNAAEVLGYDIDAQGNLVESKLNMIAIGNELRTSDTNFTGLDDLRVSLRLMTRAQITANAEQVYETHWTIVNSAEAPTSVFDWGSWTWGENLSMGHWQVKYPDLADYGGWYVEEKELYDQGERTQSVIGHYTGLCNSSYTMTGYGKNTETGGRYIQTSVQVFGGNNIDRNEKAYTLEEYRTLFKGYYDTYRANSLVLKQTMDDAYAELTRLTDLKATGNGGVTAEQQAKIEELTQKIQQAQAELVRMDAEYKSVEVSLSEKNTALDTTRTELNLNQNELADAIQLLNRAEQERVTLETEANNAGSSYDRQAATLSDAEKELAALGLQADLAQKAYDDGEAKRDAYVAQYNQETYDALQQAKDTTERDQKVAAANQNYEDQKAVLDQNLEEGERTADEEFDRTIEELQHLYDTDVADAKQARDEAVHTIEVQRDEKVKEAEDKKTASKSLAESQKESTLSQVNEEAERAKTQQEQLVKEAEDSYNAAVAEKEQVKDLSTEVEESIQAVEQAQESLNQAEEACDQAAEDLAAEEAKG